MYVKVTVAVFFKFNLTVWRSPYREEFIAWNVLTFNKKYTSNQILFRWLEMRKTHLPVVQNNKTCIVKVGYFLSENLERESEVSWPYFFVKVNL